MAMTMQTDTLEESEDVGQVEAADAGQDWNEVGTFIGKAELIDVPFRRTVKSKATIRIVHDVENDCWRAGWHWKTLLDKPGLKECGQELSRDCKPFESKAGAIYYALDSMQIEATKVDERIGEDVARYRAIACPPDPTGTTTPAGIRMHDPDANPAREYTGPDIDADGNYRRGFETVEVPIRVKTGADAFVLFIQDGECWRTGWGWDPVGSAGANLPAGEERSASLNVSRPAFTTKRAAVANALRQMADSAKPWKADLVDDIMAYHDKEWWAVESDELTAGGDAEDIADFQAETEDAAAVGLGVGDAVPASETVATGDKSAKEAAQQAKAERIFRKKFAEIAEKLADSVIERRRAEAIFKTTKATEKMFGEMLEALADKGPERHPLFEAAEGKNGKAVPEAAVTATPEAPSGDENAWKSAPISALNLPAGITEKLTGDGLDTIGRLEQRRADVANKREKWPRGVGKGAIDKIEEAIIGYLTENRKSKEELAATAEAIAPADPAAPEEQTQEAEQPEEAASEGDEIDAEFEVKEGDGDQATEAESANSDLSGI